MNAYDRIRATLANFTRYEESDIRQLESIGKRMMNGSMYGGGIIYAIAGSIREAKAVIEEPMRNCEVGTPDEQQERFNRFCKRCEDGCPLAECETIVECVIKWGQLPYEKGGAE